MIPSTVWAWTTHVDVNIRTDSRIIEDSQGIVFVANLRQSIDIVESARDVRSCRKRADFKTFYVFYFLEPLFDIIVVHVSIVGHWHHFDSGTSLFPGQHVGIVFENADKHDWECFFGIRSEVFLNLQLVLMCLSMFDIELQPSHLGAA